LSGIVGPTDERRARVAFERGCHGNRQPDACCSIAGMWRWGRGGPQDEHRAQHYFRQSCESGLRLCCERGGPDTESYGREMEARMKKGIELQSQSDPARRCEARAVFEQACAEHYAPACSWLGDLWAEGMDHGQRSGAKARFYRERACWLGFEFSCSQLRRR
jgi:TPR repeat protein